MKNVITYILVALLVLVAVVLSTDFLVGLIDFVPIQS